jgi:D-alanyl-D-alanine endopeptidase (penicillin-binding protein 7)
MKKYLIGSIMMAAHLTSSATGAYGVRSWNDYDWQHSYNVTDVRSIASITKLFTAITVLNSDVDLAQLIRVEGHSTSKFINGMMVPRIELMRAMLISSDNRAAESLARAHPGGYSQFLRDVQWEIGNMGLANTKIVEPTGLSPMNISTVKDLSDFLFYMRNNHLISSITGERTHQTQVVKGKKKITINLRNTNVAVFAYDNILISKTGTTNAAGKCVAMLIERDGDLVAVVILGQKTSSQRTVIVERLLKGNS